MTLESSRGPANPDRPGRFDGSFRHAEVRPDPYAHFFHRGVFDHYREVFRQLPPLREYEPFDVEPEVFGDYGDEDLGGRARSLPRERARRFLYWPDDGFWADLLARWSTPGFVQGVLGLFRGYGGEGFSPGDVRAQMVLVKYLEGYSLGPHTDLPDRVVSVVVYLAADHRWTDHGISVCVPDDGRRSPDGRHQGWQGFTEVVSYPYVPNAAFGFLRTDSSFHGVRPVGAFERDALVYYLKRREPSPDGA